MSITDELREWFKDRLFMGNGYAELAAIADRIDAKAADNERFRHEAEPFCDRLREAAAERADVTLFGVDYAALPLGADGVPIRVGDVMEWPDCYTAEVMGIGDDRFFYVEDGIRYAWASDKIHHHAPTVEDVLREFSCVLMGKREFDGDVAEAISEFATKLQLAGDDE